MSSENCQLSYKGNQTLALNFELSPKNLPFSKCENFSELLKKFVICNNALNLAKVIALLAVGQNAVTNGYADAYAKWNAVTKFNYCGLPYKIRLDLITSGGAVIFSSLYSTYSALVAANVSGWTLRNEVSVASETEWGLQRRSSYITGTATDFYAIWLAGVSLANNNGVINGCDKRTEVVAARFSFELDSCNNPIPSVSS